jgi:hypothetical protein
MRVRIGASPIYGDAFMSRVNGYLMFLYCGLLFSAGIVFGFLFTKTGEVSFVTFLSAASSLATIGAAVTAVYALYAWYPQFKHAEKYKLIREFQVLLAEHNAVRDYVYSCRNHLLKFIEAEEDGLSNPINLIPPEAMQNWQAHMSTMLQAWENMTLMLSDEEILLLGLSPSDLDREVDDLISALMDETFDEVGKKRKFKVVRESARGAELVVSRYRLLQDNVRRLLRAITA